MGKHRDWTDIANDYRENGLSFSQLAAKYDVPIDTLKKASARQGWTKGIPKKERVKLRNVEKAVVSVEKEMAPQNGTIQNCTARNGTSVLCEPVILEDPRERFKRLVEGMMDRVEDAIAMVPPEQVQALKLLTGALKDLRSLARMDKDELDIEEQKARIAKLKSETRISESTDGGGVLVLPTIEEKLLPPGGDHE